MALVSNIVISLVNQTVNLRATVDDNLVEDITYDKTTNQITFAERGEFVINFDEFLPFCDQVNIFQTAILFNFPSIDVFSVIPFSQLVINELHDGDTWDLTVSNQNDPNIVEYICTKSTTQTDMLKRSPSKTIEFPEWTYFLQALNHYRLSIKNF